MPEFVPKPPADCADMAQLRAAIDALDAHLVGLLAVRQGYMDRAAILKPARGQVRDEARIEDVMSKVSAQAAKQGLSPAIAEPVWRLLIERCIAHEFTAFDARTRLAVYGSLAPGQSNHHELDGITGRWSKGTVRGTLYKEGWGAAIGFPGLVLDANGATVPVQILESNDLPAHWARLDNFEGEGYRRAVTQIETAAGPVGANIYVLAHDATPVTEIAILP